MCIYNVKMLSVVTFFCKKKQTIEITCNKLHSHKHRENKFIPSKPNGKASIHWGFSLRGIYYKEG